MDACRRLRRLSWCYGAAVVALVAAADRGVLDVSWLAGVPGADKVGHFVLIGLLSYLANAGLRGARLRWGRLSVLRGSLLVAGLVALEELSQLWLLHRSFELADLSADLAGIWVFGRLAAASMPARRLAAHRPRRLGRLACDGGASASRAPEKA